MAAEATPRPAYSTGLVAAILVNWPLLASDGWPGRLPMKKWALATRGGKRRHAGAGFENGAAYRSDIELALPRLDPQTRRVVELRMAGLTVRAMGRKLDRSYSTATRYLDRAIGELTDILNHGGEDVPRASEGKARPANGRNGQHAPDTITSAEQETLTLYDALDQKLAKLPPTWSEVHVKKAMAGSYQIRVVY